MSIYKVRKIKREYTNMRLLIHDNKKAWIVCITGLSLAMLCYILFPDWLPSEWLGFGMKDTYAEKVSIFFFPAVQAVLLVICDRKKTREWCLRSRVMPKNIYQYHAVVLAAVIILLLAELCMVYISFRY